MLWTAEPWVDTPSALTDESLEKILRILSKDRMAGWSASAISEEMKAGKTAVYKKLGRLEALGKVKKEGNVYFLSVNQWNQHDA